MNHLGRLVELIRHVMGFNQRIPHVDPRDGGADAEVLLLL
jgi:hypothetical protein